MAVDTRFRRVLVKLSGEGLLGDQEYGIDSATADRLAAEVRTVRNRGIELAVVVGGGNIFRGVSGVARGMNRTTADNMGMMATVMNALALQSALEARDVPARVQSAIPMDAVCEPYIRRQAVRHLEKGRVVIFAAGTGNPFFTTDTAAALRAAETECDALLKGTQVDGVYSGDPRRDGEAVRYGSLSYREVLSRDLKVMDTSAISLARDSNLPVLVFNIHSPGNLGEVVAGRGRYTIVHQEV